MSIFHCEKNGHEQGCSSANCRCLFVTSSSTRTITCSIPRSQNECRESFRRTVLSSLMRPTTLVKIAFVFDLISDNVCIESLSIDLFDETLKKAGRGVTSLEKKIEKFILTPTLLTL